MCGGATADSAFLNDDRAATTPPLAAAGHYDVYASLLGSVTQQGACGHLHVPTSGLEVNGDGADDHTSHSKGENQILSTPP
jgi:hypothetical protein